MRTKILTLVIIIIIALSTIGYSYSYLNGGIQTDCPSYNCSVIFTKVITYDNEVVKDVGQVRAQIASTSDVISVCITNAYPGYIAYVNYTFQNVGQLPVCFVSLTIVNPHPEALQITSTNFTCTWLQPCQIARGQTTVHVLQPAKQNAQYTFQIGIGLTCQTKVPCTTEFWRQQFSSVLGGQSDPQVDAKTLEQYLNQISSQSTIFKFTGTQGQKFQQTLNTLSPSSNSIMEAKLKAQLLTLWLNYVAGCTGGYESNGMTAYQIIQGSENALLNHQTSQYSYFNNLCEDFNSLT